MSTPNPGTTPWVPLWPISDPPLAVPTPVNGKWLGAAGGAMVWQDIPGLVTPDSGWTIPTLLNGWVQYADPYGPVRFRKLASGLVICNGLMSTGPNSTAAFTFPVGYRPAPQAGGTDRQYIFQCAMGGGTAGEACRVSSSTGNLTITSAMATSWIDISGVIFWAG